MSSFASTSMNNFSDSLFDHYPSVFDIPNNIINWAFEEIMEMFVEINTHYCYAGILNDIVNKFYLMEMDYVHNNSMLLSSLAKFSDIMGENFLLCPETKEKAELSYIGNVFIVLFAIGGKFRGNRPISDNKLVDEAIRVIIVEFFIYFLDKRTTHNGINEAHALFWIMRKNSSDRIYTTSLKDKSLHSKILWKEKSNCILESSVASSTTSEFFSALLLLKFELIDKMNEHDTHGKLHMELPDLFDEEGSYELLLVRQGFTPPEIADALEGRNVEEY